MKTQKAVLAVFSGLALAFAGVAGVAAAQAPASADARTATYQTPQGELTVTSSPAPAPSYGAPPAFAKLAGGGTSISPEQADAYPPLANDFLHADQNRDGHVSKAEYERWVKQS